MKRIFDVKKLSTLALGLMAFVPGAMAQDKVETTIAADFVSQYYCVVRIWELSPCSLLWE